MQQAAHLLTWQARRWAAIAKAPVWSAVWGQVQRTNGPDRFPSYDDFLRSSTDVYKYLQGELLAAEHTRHLEDLVEENLRHVIRATNRDYEEVRRQFGPEACRIEWQSVEAFVCSLGPPELAPAPGGGPGSAGGAPSAAPSEAHGAAPAPGGAPGEPGEPGEPGGALGGGEDAKQVIVAGARFFTVMGLSYAPGSTRRSIDDVIFRSAWDPKTGVVQWRVAFIGGPVSPPFE